MQNTRITEMMNGINSRNPNDTRMSIKRKNQQTPRKNSSLKIDKNNTESAK